MSDFEMQHDYNDHNDDQLNQLFEQLGPDALPAGFIGRTMTSIRPTIEPEPFRIQWLDFVPAFVVAAMGALLLFIWLGAAGAHTSFEQSFNAWRLDQVLGSISDVQMVILCGAIGMLWVIMPYMRSGSKRRNVWFLSLVQ